MALISRSSAGLSGGMSILDCFNQNFIHTGYEDLGAQKPLKKEEFLTYRIKLV